MMSQSARFQLYVKAGQDGKCMGDCPFSQRVSMFSYMKMNLAEIEIIPVDTINKPDSFLKLNPEGKVPVLVDKQNENKVIPDSGKIIEYLSTLYPKPEGGECDQTGLNAISGIFPKFAAFMKNKDESAETGLRDALVVELKKLNDFLTQKGATEEFINGGKLCDADCQTLPKLRHVQVAGKHYKQFEIPAHFEALFQYIKMGEASDVFKNTCPADEQIVWGWSKFFN